MNALEMLYIEDILVNIGLGNGLMPVRCQAIN